MKMIFLGLGFIGSLAAQAADSQAHISYILGEVELRSAPGQPSQKARLGQAVPAKGIILTHARSVATLTLPDLSVIKVGRDSEVALQELSSETTGGTVLSLIAGSLFSKVQKQAGQKQFKVQTKSVSMGVRGTQFFTAVESKHGGVWMCVKEGRVAVEESAHSKVVLVQEGEGVLVPAGKPATAPRPYAWTKKLNWNMDPGAGEVLDETPMPGYGDLREQNYD